jgi:hypothetical protein
MIVDRVEIWPEAVVVEMPVGLKHIDSEVCWCDPVGMTNEHGQEVLVHKQVTWN